MNNRGKSRKKLIRLSSQIVPSARKSNKAEDIRHKDNLKLIYELEVSPGTLSTRMNRARNQSDTQVIPLIKEITRIQEEERKRIAYELHDSAVPNLTLLGLEIDNILKDKEKLQPDIFSQLTKIKTELNNIQKEIRQYSHELRPGALDFLGLPAALENLIEDAKTKGRYDAELEIKGVEQPLTEDIQLTLYRITQEALNNIIKHSQASKVCIRLRYFSDKISLVISDNGQGFNVKQGLEAAVRRGSLGLID
jgi:signal transduction histidine kinase